MTDEDVIERVGVTHIGLCVSDFDRSLRFYTEGLGFEVAEGWDIPSSLAHLAEVPPPVNVRSQMIVKNGWKLELLGWREPLGRGRRPRDPPADRLHPPVDPCDRSARR